MSISVRDKKHATEQRLGQPGVADADNVDVCLVRTMQAQCKPKMEAAAESLAKRFVVAPPTTCLCAVGARNAKSKIPRHTTHDQMSIGLHSPAQAATERTLAASAAC